MELNELIDRAKSLANLKSDYALAKAMGKPNGIIAGWRKGKRHPSNEEAIQLATLAHLDEMSVIAAIELATAKNEDKKKFWQHYIESRGLAATLALTGMAISLILTPEPSEASTLHNAMQSEVEFKNLATDQENKSVLKNTVLYIMRSS
jgi:hypothetical protein